MGTKDGTKAGVNVVLDPKQNALTEITPEERDREGEVIFTTLFKGSPLEKDDLAVFLKLYAKIKAKSETEAAAVTNVQAEVAPKLKTAAELLAEVLVEQTEQTVEPAPMTVPSASLPISQIINAQDKAVPVEIVMQSLEVAPILEPVAENVAAPQEVIAPIVMSVAPIAEVLPVTVPERKIERTPSIPPLSTRSSYPPGSKRLTVTESSSILSPSSVNFFNFNDSADLEDFTETAPDSNKEQNDFATEYKVSKKDKLKLGLESMAIVETDRFVEKQEYDKTMDRVRANRRALVSPIVSPIAWLAEPAAALFSKNKKASWKEKPFNLKEWALAPLNTFIVKPVKTIAKVVSKISPTVRRNDKQNALIESQIQSVKSAHKQQFSIEGLGWEAVTEYAALLNAQGDELGKFSSPKDFWDICMNSKNADNEHYKNVQALINERKVNLTDETDQKIAEIEKNAKHVAADLATVQASIDKNSVWNRTKSFVSNIFKSKPKVVVAPVSQKEAQETAADLAEFKAANKGKSVWGRAMAFIGLSSVPKEEVAVKAAEPKVVEPKIETAKKSKGKAKYVFGLAMAGLLGLAAMTVGHFKKDKTTSYGAAPEATSSVSATASAKPVESAMPVAVAAVTTASLSTTQPVQTDLPKAAESEVAKPTAKSPAKPTVGLAGKAPVKAKVATLTGAKPVKAKSTTVTKTAEKSPKVETKTTVSEDAPLTDAELNAALTTANAKVSQYNLAAKALGQEFSVPGNAKASLAYYPDNQLPKFDIDSVNGLLDQVVASLKTARTHKDLKKIEGLYTQIDTIVSKNASNRAMIIFNATINADIPVLMSTEKMVKESKNLLAGKSKKFVIMYDQKSVKSGTSELKSFRPIEVDLDAYQTEFNGYAQEYTNARETNVPIAEARLRVIHSRITWLHQQMSFVKGYLAYHKDFNGVNFS